MISNRPILTDSCSSGTNFSQTFEYEAGAKFERQSLSWEAAKFLDSMGFEPEWGEEYLWGYRDRLRWVRWVFRFGGWWEFTLNVCEDSDPEVGGRLRWFWWAGLSHSCWNDKIMISTVTKSHINIKIYRYFLCIFFWHLLHLFSPNRHATYTSDHFHNNTQLYKV